MPENLESSAVTTGLEKVSFSSSPKERQCQKMLNYHTTVVISHASEVMLKIIQARLQQCVNRELPDVQTGFRKSSRIRDQIANIHWSTEKAREFQKNIYFCIIDYAKAFVWITTNCGKFFKGWEHQITLSASWETYMQVKKLQLKPDMKQWSGSKLGMEYVKAVCCHLAYITFT